MFLLVSNVTVWLGMGCTIWTAWRCSWCGEVCRESFVQTAGAGNVGHTAVAAVPGAVQCGPAWRFVLVWKCNQLPVWQMRGVVPMLLPLLCPGAV